MSNEHVIFWQSTKTDPNKLIAPYFKLMTTGTGFVVHKNLLQTRANCMICVLYFLQELSFLLHLFHTSQYSYLKLDFFFIILIIYFAISEYFYVYKYTHNFTCVYYAEIVWYTAWLFKFLYTWQKPIHGDFSWCSYIMINLKLLWWNAIFLYN